MDKLTREQCQAIIDYDHNWEMCMLTKKDGSLKEEPEQRNFDQAPFVMWGDIYPNMLKERVTRYREGTYCRLHHDNRFLMIRPNYSAYAVWITPLNDDYEGGDVYFDGELIEQVVGVPIKRKRIIPHEVTEVTKGIRYSLVSWIFRKNDKRRQFNI